MNAKRGALRAGIVGLGAMMLAACASSPGVDMSVPMKDGEG